MSQNQAEDNTQLLNCDICLDEIPVNGDEYNETDEYVIHLCGIECYNQWKAEKSKAAK